MKYGLREDSFLSQGMTQGSQAASNSVSEMSGMPENSFLAASPAHGSQSNKQVTKPISTFATPKSSSKSAKTPEVNKN